MTIANNFALKLSSLKGRYYISGFRKYREKFLKIVLAFKLVRIYRSYRGNLNGFGI